MHQGQQRREQQPQGICQSPEHQIVGPGLSQGFYGLLVYGHIVVVVRDVCIQSFQKAGRRQDYVRIATGIIKEKVMNYYKKVLPLKPFSHKVLMGEVHYWVCVEDEQALYIILFQYLT